MSDYFCTVFTPTYNRAHLLENAYNSLVKQSFQDFEWLIVDDGSEDNTEEIVNNFIEQNKINIKYIKKENGGKHRAINVGVKNSNGKVFAILDSDDVLTENALELIYQHFIEIEKVDKKYAGIAVNKGYRKDSLVGTTFNGLYIDAKSNERRKYNIDGDKFEVFYTSVMKQYEFPCFENENFMSEVVVWNRMAKDGYLLRFYNDILYLCDYLDDGITKNQFRLFKRNPKGYALRIRELVEFGNITFKDKIGYYSNFYFIFKNDKNLLEMRKEIDANIFVFILAIILRKTLFLIGRMNENDYKLD